MEYTQLEKKVLEKMRRKFRDEVFEASKELGRVLGKYGFTNGHKEMNELLETFKVRPTGIFGAETGVWLPHGEKLEAMNSVLLDKYMKELEEIKERIEDLEI